MLMSHQKRSFAVAAVICVTSKSARRSIRRRLLTIDVWLRSSWMVGVRRYIRIRDNDEARNAPAPAPAPARLAREPRLSRSPWLSTLVSHAGMQSSDIALKGITPRDRNRISKWNGVSTHSRERELWRSRICLSPPPQGSSCCCAICRGRLGGCQRGSARRRDVSCGRPSGWLTTACGQRGRDSECRVRVENSRLANTLMRVRRT